MGAVKRIAFVTDFYPEVHGKWFGAEIACKRLRELLSEEGSARVDVYTGSADFRDRLDPGIREVPVLEDLFGAIALSIKTALPFDPLAWRFFLRAFRETRPDVVHLHNIKRMSFAPLVAARSLGIPVVFSVYDNWSFCPKSALVLRSGAVCTRFHGPWCSWCVPLKKGPFVLFRRPVFRRFLRMVDRFAVLTKSERESFVRNGADPRRIDVLPLPLFSRPGTTDASKVMPLSILFVGRIEHGKGLHALVEAMKGVLERFPDAHVDVVGDHSGSPDYRERVAARIRELGCEGAFTFHGKRGNDEVRSFLERAHVVAVPEQWSIAWPIFLTEAMSMGKVIVASRIGDIPEFIEDGRTGLLADPSDPGDFSRKIITALEEGVLVNEAARERVLSLTDPRSITGKLLAIYRAAEHAGLQGRLATDGGGLHAGRGHRSGPG